MDDNQADISDYDDGRVVFHYSREHRLSKASAAVRAMNEAKPPQKRGLFRTLTATKPLTFGFVSILTICLAMILYSLFGTGRSAVRAGNTEIKVEAIAAEEKTYIAVHKKVKGGDPYTGAADFIVSTSSEKAGADETDIKVHAERLYFSLENEEVFRFTVPFSGENFLIFAVLDEDRALIRVRAQH